jgi:predicted dehydrogenase
MTKKYNIGIIGFGGAGLALAKIFDRRSDCVVTKAFDIKEAGLERARNYSKNILATSDYNEFRKASIDIVVITSPDKTHADYLVDAVNDGRNVLCEKPLTDSVEGISKIMDVVNRNPQRVVAVQHQMRFLPVHKKIKELIKSGELGSLSYLEGFYVHNLQKRASENDNWRFEDNATPLIYSGIHFIDLLRWFAEDEITEISGFANNINFPEYPESDLNVVIFKFKSGAIGKVITAFGAQRPQDHSVQIYGSRKSIKDNILFSRDGKFEIIARPLPNTQKERKYAFLKDYVVIIFSKIFELVMKLYPDNPQYSISGFPIRLYEHSMAVESSVNNFMDGINLNTKLDCDVVEAAKSVAVALAGVEAYRTESVVKVDKYWVFPS